MTKNLDSIILRYVGYGLVALGFAFLLYLVRGALPIFFVGGLVAYALEPILRNLERRGWSRGGAVGFVSLIFILLLLLGLALLASAVQQAQALHSNLGTLQEKAQTVLNNAEHKLDASRLPGDVKKSVHDAVNNLREQALSKVPNGIQVVLPWALGSAGDLLVLLIVLPIITIWLMIEANPMRARMLMLVPPQYRRDVTAITSDINELLGRYVRGQLIVCGGYGVLCTITFYVLSWKYGMGYPLVLGILAGLVYIVPYLGLLTVMAAAGLTAYFTSSSPLACAGIAIGACAVYSGIMDYLVSPRVLGRGVGLHPLMVIFALLCGAQLGGPLGMILAVPFFATLRVIAIRVFPQLAAPIPPAIPAAYPALGSPDQALLAQTREAEQSVNPTMAAVARDAEALTESGKAS